MFRIDISGLDKVALLKNMWLCSYPLTSSFSSESFDAIRAPLAVKRYINYYQRRPIKSDISGDMVDSYLYDLHSRVPLIIIVDRMRGK